MHRSLKRPRFSKDPNAVIGRLVMVEEQADAQGEVLTDARGRIERLENQVRFLEERLASLTRPKELLTEKEAAAMIRVHVETLKTWRKERPARIPFILLEGGDIRYRVEAIEGYLKSRERGTAKTSLRAARVSAALAGSGDRDERRL
jgi:hypothetical protein